MQRLHGGCLRHYGGSLSDGLKTCVREEDPEVTTAELISNGKFGVVISPDQQLSMLVLNRSLYS